LTAGTGSPSATQFIAAPAPAMRFGICPASTPKAPAAAAWKSGSSFMPSPMAECTAPATERIDGSSMAPATEASVDSAAPLVAM
jgi:hypothetical protein